LAAPWHPPPPGGSEWRSLKNRPRIRLCPIFRVRARAPTHVLRTGTDDTRPVYSPPPAAFLGADGDDGSVGSAPRL
jgi:hypothetical protein